MLGTVVGSFVGSSVSMIEYVGPLVGSLVGSSVSSSYVDTQVLPSSNGGYVFNFLLFVLAFYLGVYYLVVILVQF